VTSKYFRLQLFAEEYCLRDPPSRLLTAAELAAVYQTMQEGGQSLSISNQEINLLIYSLLALLAVSCLTAQIVLRNLAMPNSRESSGLNLDPTEQILRVVQYFLRTSRSRQ